jgi:lysophosphatidic acid acyltransferase/lysophosphatidylinositol acyltransferase
LQGTKIYGKSSLRWVPLIGWAWMFTESIFLRRDWDKDKEIISRDLKYIRDYPDNYWVTVSKQFVGIIAEIVFAFHT